METEKRGEQDLLIQSIILITTDSRMVRATDLAVWLLWREASQEV